MPGGKGKAPARFAQEVFNFSQDGEYIQNLDDNDDGRAKTETAVTAALSTHFSLKASYVWKWVGVPPVGLGHSDTLTTISLIAVY